MRRAAIGLGLVGVLVTLQGTARGDDIPTVPSTVTLRSAPMVKIVGIRRLPTGNPIVPAPYTSGPLDVLVDVENTSDKPAADVTVKLGLGPSTLEQVVSVPAKKRFTLKFTDPIGLTSSCSARIYDLSLGGSGVDPTPRKGRVTPSCTFSSSVQDPWNLATPDRVEAAQKNRVFVRNVSLVSAPTCTTGLKLKGTIYNKSQLSSPSVLVQAKAQEKVKAQTPAAFPLAKGESKAIELAPVPGANDVDEKVELGIVDWTKSLGAAVMNQGITVTTTRQCMLTFSLD